MVALSIVFTLVLAVEAFSLGNAASQSLQSERDSTLESRKTPPWRARNLATIQKIYNLTVYPNNVPIINQGSSAVPAGLFNQKAVGRVSPVGNFSGFDDSIEYFFALAPAPQQEGGVAFYDAEVVEFTSGCPDVAASVVYLRTGMVNGKTGKLDTTKPTTTLSQVAFWKFDKKGQVLKYAAWIPNISAWVKTVTGFNFEGVTGFLLGAGSGAALCPIIQQRCKGDNAQYPLGQAGNAACITAMLTKRPGSFDEAWGDTVACRAIHLILAQVRPEIHCPHVGPKGGNGPDNYKCVDIDYSEEYFNDAELFGAPLGNVFTCDRPLLD